MTPPLVDHRQVSEALGLLGYFQASFVVPTGTGRSRGSQVWKYFSCHAAEDVSQCQVKIKDDDGNEVTCGKRIAKKFPSILRNQLEIHHADIFKLVEDEERK
jgi:hypothetical protein